MGKSSSNHRFTTITTESLILVLKILLLSNFQFVFYSIPSWLVWGKDLVSETCNCRSCETWAFKQSFLIILEVMKPTSFFESHLSLSDTSVVGP